MPIKQPTSPKPNTHADPKTNPPGVEPRCPAAPRNEIRRLGLELAAAGNPTEIATIAHDLCARLWNWDAFLLSVRRSGGHMQFRTIRVVDTIDGRRVECPQFDYAANLYDRLSRLLEGTGVVLNRNTLPSTPAPGSFGDAARPSASLVYAPIIAGQEVIGILSVQSYTRGFFHTRDRKMLEEIGRILGPSLQRCRQQEQSRLFADVGIRINMARTSHEAAVIVADAAQAMLTWDACVVNLYDESRKRQITVLIRDEIDGRRERDVTKLYEESLPTPVARRVLRYGPMMLLRQSGDNILRGPRLIPFGDVTRRSASLLFVPLRSADRNVGMLTIQSYKYHAYTHVDLETLQALADQMRDLKLELEKQKPTICLLYTSPSPRDS